MKLPKKQNRREAKLDKKIAERIRETHPHKNWALEVKIGNKKPSRHQQAALKRVEDGRFLYKIPDQGARNPFDYVCLGDADAIVCTVHGGGKKMRDVTCTVNNVYDFTFRIRTDV